MNQNELSPFTRQDRSDTKYKFAPPIVSGTKPPAVDVSDRDELHDFLDEK